MFMPVPGDTVRLVMTGIDICIEACNNITVLFCAIHEFQNPNKPDERRKAYSLQP